MKNPISFFGAKTLICLSTALMLAACGGGGGGGGDDSGDSGNNGGGGNNSGSGGDGRPHTLTLKLQGLPDGSTLPLTFGNVTQGLTTNTSIPITGINPTVSLGKLTFSKNQPYLVQCSFAEPLAGSIKSDGSLQTSLSADATQVVQCNQKVSVILEQRQINVLPADAGSGLNVLTANLDGTQAQWLSPALMVQKSTVRNKLAALIGNELYISAKDDDINSATGWELRATDGTASGTRLVKDIFPQQTAGVGLSSNPSNLTSLGEKVFFMATGGSNQDGVWISDGTDSGTQIVKFNGSPFQTDSLVAAGDKMFATVRSTGQFVSIDGEGTVTDLGITTWNNAVAAGDHIVITDESGTRQFISDGTVSGTKEFTAAAMASTPVQIGDWLYFYGAAYGETDFSQIHLWKSKIDGSEAQLVKAINTSGASEISIMANLNGVLVFSANDGTQTGIYSSDGSASGTKLIHAIKGSLTLGTYAVVNNHLIFLDSEDRDLGNGNYIWTTDGTTAGTQRLAAEGVTSFITKNTGGTGYTAFQNAGSNRLVFLIHKDSSNKADAWITDGTTAGTRKLQDKNGTAIDVLESAIYAL